MDVPCDHEINQKGGRVVAGSLLPVRLGAGGLDRALLQVFAQPLNAGERAWYPK
jgi:hypothetical protein